MSVSSLKVTTSRQVIEVEDSYAGVTVRNLGPDLLYYGGASVSSLVNDGSIASGAETTFSVGKTVVSAGRSRLALTVESSIFTLRPAASTRNVVQPSTDARPLTVKARAAGQTKDWFRIERSNGAPLLRFGYGGSSNGGAAAQDAEVPLPSDPDWPSLILTGPSQLGAGGRIGIISDGGAHFIGMSALTYDGGGAGPHFYLDMARGRAASEYWYTEIVHKHAGLHKHAQGVEHFGAGSEHFFFGPIHSDVGGVLAYSHTFVTDIATGRTIFNPDVTALPATYTSAFEFRGMGAALPVLKLTPATSQTEPLIDLAGGGFIQGTEAASDPAAPAANGYRLYSRDNGAGKTQLCVRFSSGAVQVLATQP